MDLETSYAKLYMDSELHHSSGYFRGGATTLLEAQLTKVETVLAQLALRPGMKMLDVGCGWGATARAAATNHHVNVVGITLSQSQVTYAQERARDLPNGTPPVEFRCQRWEDFNEPVDRIVCVNAFENFSRKRDFLQRCRTWLRPDGRMVMVAVTADRPLFRVVSKATITSWAKRAELDVEISPSLATDYAKTLDLYVRNLEANAQQVASLVGPARYSHAVNYYSNCAEFLRSGLNDMFEFTFSCQ